MILLLILLSLHLLFLAAVVVGGVRGGLIPGPGSVVGPRRAEDHLVSEVALRVGRPLFPRREHPAAELARPAHHHGVGAGVMVESSLLEQEELTFL
jgi:hypothetical protein